MPISALDKRLASFVFGCIPARLGLVYLAYKYYADWSVGLAFAATVLAVGFLAIYVLGLRKTGAEVFGETIWWNDLRPVHAVIWGLFAYFVAQKNPLSYTLPLLDAVIGTLAWSHFHLFVR
jgi:hypothetical protein